MPKLCPHCREELEYLSYREDAIVYGSYSIETEDYEQDETDVVGGLILSCPECEETINSINDLINSEEEEERQHSIGEDMFNHPSRITLSSPPLNEEEKELPVPPAINDEWKGEYSGYNNRNNMPKPSEIIICPQCGNKNEAKIDEELKCYNCNKKFNRNTAKKIIPLNNNNQGIF